MKQSTIIFLVLFSLLITGAQSRGKHGTSNQRVNRRSLLVYTNITQAPMTITSFEKGGDGGGPSSCDGQYHSNSFFFVALPTRWYNGGQRCFDSILIYYTDKYVQAMVIDECDSDDCPDNMVVASRGIWKALQVPQSEWGETEVTWSVRI
ncbi:hypothetical protein L2E82_45847 [Cichorium intybus]|uniref:Uncharacterized protein n=1 Tax=Cichorium intybus TaxID=13427 RepID=A0ACB8ZUN0_CICIN|nr:hypothetical protein L2E82_45847 [Cichorium intybus]